MIFELHLTFPASQREMVRQVAKTAPQWTFSAIDNDPILGPGVKCYLTSYDKDYGNAVSKVRAMGLYCAQNGLLPLREKVEMIVYDTKESV